MEIKKILNNNAVVASKGNEEVIVIGRGVAYNKRVGDHVSEETIEKVFTLENEEMNRKYKALIADMPIEYLELSERIVNYATIKLGKKLSESLYIHLTDHIHFAVERTRSGMIIKNGLLWETKQLYKEEYEIGLEALNMILEQFGVILPEDEAGFLALHIVNAGMNEEMPVVKKMTKIMQDILTIIKYHFRIEFDESSLGYYRFITHLKFFAQRLVKGTHYNRDQFEDMLTVIREKYANAYECAVKIRKFVENQHSYQLSDEELMYLTIHIQRVVYKKESTTI
ncbi:BglG family transcription antiterminator LicT [Saccharibacillus kuerlensis]|uniref:Transcription antiterminator LicT n=1 Tax=Saccharibacillus kuerlensis TaxID=459527 RepID=A0ABQ2L4B5_9BACL|nr:PRD domain-containing protein [Saccharibacillus kuerlensis]GGO02389.1 transcription antiterminator LicT [Saccharibacillus kuerlensis]